MTDFTDITDVMRGPGRDESLYRALSSTNPENTEGPDPGHYDPPTAPKTTPEPPPPTRAPAKSAGRGKKNAPLENLESLGTTSQVPQTTSNIHCLTIVGQVEGHLALPPQNKTTKYEHVIPQLVAVEQNPEIEGLLLILNTVGGDVEAGLAIAEMIASLSKPSVSLVLGGGHSIGGPIAVSTTYSFIASTATMTVHPIRLTGLVIGVPMPSEMHTKRMCCRSTSGLGSRPRCRLSRRFRLKPLPTGRPCVGGRSRRGGPSVRSSTTCASRFARRRYLAA